MFHPELGNTTNSYAYKNITLKRWIEDFWNDYRKVITFRITHNTRTLSQAEENELKQELQKLTVIYDLSKVVFDNQEESLEEYRKWVDNFHYFSDKVISRLYDWENISTIQGEVQNICWELLWYLQEKSWLSAEAIREIYGSEILALTSNIQTPYQGELFHTPRVKLVAPSIDEILDSDCPHWAPWYYSYERKTEKLWNEVYEQIFQPQIASGDLNERQAKRMMIKLNLAYSLAKLKFQWVTRESGERYFEHLREVTLISLRKGMTKDFDEVLISLLHDIIEDTDISYNTLKELFWERVALWVQLISKPAFSDFLDKGDKETWKEKVESANILNSKWLLNDATKKKERAIISAIWKEKYKDILEKWKDWDFWKESIIYLSDITKEEFVALSTYHRLSKKYKDVKKPPTGIIWSQMRNSKTVEQTPHFRTLSLMQKASEMMVPLVLKQMIQKLKGFVRKLCQ